MRSQKGMRSMLVNQTYQSYLMAYGSGNFYQAANLLKALSRLVGVKIGTPWFGGHLYYSDNLKHEKYCSLNLDAVMIGVDKYLKKHGRNTHISLWTKADDEALAEEEEGEE